MQGKKESQELSITLCPISLTWNYKITYVELINVESITWNYIKAII
ncbi:hypothetical protein SAMN05518672_10578 [Chitinophaga sp. CF118]|nr:hypothetical protein SAMN05518672_10578 [Chitinophaga sp. CF118]